MKSRHNKAIARVEEPVRTPVRLPMDMPIPTPPPRPLRMDEWFDTVGTYRTQPAAREYLLKCDFNCTAEDDAYNVDEIAFARLDDLERKRWDKFVARTPLPKMIRLSFVDLDSIIEQHTRLVDCCRLPSAMVSCSCGAIVTCIRDHPERGPVRWHRVKYVPEKCCSCLGTIISLEDAEFEREEELVGVCSSCMDCYEVVA